MPRHHQLWQLGLIASTLALTSACSKKKTKDESTPTEIIVAPGDQPDPASSGGTAIPTKPAKLEPRSLSETEPYEPQLLPGQLSINFPSFLLALAGNNAAGLRLAEEAASEGEAAPLGEDVSVATDGSAPNGASQLALYAQQFMEGISGSMYDALLLDQNWSEVEAYCQSENSDDWTACHIPAGTLNYEITPEVIAAVIKGTGGLDQEAQATLRLQDEDSTKASDDLTAEDYAAVYAEEIDDGYDEIYGDMLSQVSSTEPNPDTFIWMAPGGDNPCSDPRFGAGVRFVRNVDGFYNETATICFNAETGLVSTSVESKFSYDYGDRVVTDSYDLSVEYDPLARRSVMASKYRGDNYSYDTKMTLTESDDGLTITGLNSYEYDGYKSSMRQTAFVAPDGTGYLESDEDLSYFSVSAATTDFTTTADVWYSIYPTGADPDAVGSIGGFLGNGTITPDYPSYWGPTNNLTGLDVHACEWTETTESIEGVDVFNWAYQCSTVGHVNLVGTTEVYSYRYKEFFGEQSGWQVIDPESGEVLYSSDDTYADAGVFADYEAMSEEAVSTSAGVTVSVSYAGGVMNDLLDEDYTDAVDVTGGVFYLVACESVCTAEISENGDTVVMNAVGYSYISYDSEGQPFVDNYVWANIDPEANYGLYYYDFSDINAEGFAKAKLVPGSITVTVTE